MIASGTAGTGKVTGDGAKTTTTVSMTYDSSNRMLTYNGEDILYDKDGNMIYGPLNGEMVEFEYDCRNRLIKAGDTTYQYDAENNRVGVETSEYIEEYIIDSSNSLSQVLEVERTYKDNTQNLETETYYYGYGLIYEKTEDSGILVYHYNHLGSTVAITDEAGKLLLSYDYGTYGELNQTTEYDQNTPEIRFLYNGMMGVITDDNGLYHMRARYYNPQIKRFMNQDVLIGNIANSSSLNRYSYVEGNPISYTDPFGLSPWMQLLHTGLDILGAIPLPFFEAFDGLNAAIYFFEGKWGEAIKSIIYMAPGVDLLSKATNYAVKGGKYAKQALVVAEYATIASRTMAALMSAEDFGKAVAGMIDKYLVYEAEITWEIAYDFLVLAATGVQLGFYTGSAFKIPDELAKYDFDEIMKQNIRARYETTAVDGYISGVTVNYSTLSNAGKGGKTSGSRFPENPNDLFPDDYAGLTKVEKPDGKIDFIVEAGQEKYIVEYHTNHGGEEHFSGNHYHVKREKVNPANNKKIKYRLDNRNPLTPCRSDVYEYPKTFSPGDLLPTINKSGGKK